MILAFFAFTFVISAFLPSAQLILPANTQEFPRSYIARIGPNNHFNSRGVRLKNASAIIRQDRANFHKTGTGDAEDEYDSYFGSKANRGRMEGMLRDGTSIRPAINMNISH